ncbi:MAG: M14 family zinc carboxypeptidase [Acidobacteriota bacterium]
MLPFRSIRCVRASASGMLALGVLAFGPGAAGEEPSLESPPEHWLAVRAEEPWVVFFDTAGGPEEASGLDRRFDLWDVAPGGERVWALVSEREWRDLRSEGYEPRLDEEQTRTLEGLGERLALQGGGIPGFPCYRTVEETLATGAALAADHPSLATWIDVGDSWLKTQDPSSGFDLFVLKLTQSAVPGPKPIFFANFAIHAREYATAELGTRFAEWLVAGYGGDPNITWLLDHHEVHLMLQSNPDGRVEAEAGAFWRKNVNNAHCPDTSDRGVDLNRNFDFQWGCCGGSSGFDCSTVYRGPLAGSEPEIMAQQAYVRSIFPDQRGPGLDDPAPADATGVAIDVHSFSELVLWPWGFTTADSPNAAAFRTLGRKLAFFNGYRPIPIHDLTIADGSSADFYYGELGVAGLAFEIGTTFFQSCSFFESDLLEPNLEALLFAAKSARAPFLEPSGPEALDVTVTPSTVEAGALVQLTATVDDSRFSTAEGVEPSQTIALAEAFVGAPPGAAGAAPQAMAATDGTYDETLEAVALTLETAGLAPGRHLVFVRGSDAGGREGVVSAAFLEIEDSLFRDDFESGGTGAWAQTVP